MSEPTKDSVEYIANKFTENPGHFAAIILRMYWDMKEQRDQFKSERDTLIDDIAVLKAKVSRLERENEKQLELLQDFSKFINYKLVVSPANDTYKHYRSELDKLVVK